MLCQVCKEVVFWNWQAHGHTVTALKEAPGAITQHPPGGEIGTHQITGLIGKKDDQFE
jgi:hypothetical protein